jgi:hypothetical protein
MFFEQKHPLPTSVQNLASFPVTLEEGTGRGSAASGLSNPDQTATVAREILLQQFADKQETRLAAHAQRPGMRHERFHRF